MTPKIKVGAPPWKVGDWAIVAVVGGPKFVFIYAVSERRCDVLACDGVPGSEHHASLLSVDGYREHCDRMADEWTGAQYRAAIEKSRCVPVLHPEWPKWLAVASAPITESWDITCMPADWERRIAHLLRP